MTYLTIGELSDRSGVATSALRYYESHGLISSVRTSGNQRRFARATLRRVAFVRSAQRVGLTLDEIGEALATLPESRTPTKADWARLSRSWRPRIDEQIERLERLRDRLDSCIGCGCLSLRRCALSNPGDVLAARGPGAVNLEPGA
jgi:MerR family redox-sensitive transcriptional activator SoxR